MNSKGQDMIQIQFLDKNVVGALAPAFSMKPERIVFFVRYQSCERECHA